MNENDKKLQGKVHSAMYTLVKEKGVASPVEVLIAIGALSKEDYEKWRNGKVDFLERVCKINLRKLSFVNREIRAYARKHNLKASWTFYNKWGKKRKDSAGRTIKLRFSKSGAVNIEKLYATHYVGQQKVAEAKERKKQREARKNQKVPVSRHEPHEDISDPLCEAFEDDSIPSYARCRSCFNDMRTANGCQPFVYSAGGKKYTRIKVGDIGDMFGEDDYNADFRCTDCGALFGYAHHVGCYCERCPVCNGQMRSCGCALFDTPS